MKKRFRVALLVLVLAALVATAAGCGGYSPAPRSTRILSVTVTPHSGAGKFTLSVTYSYGYGGDNLPETISCRYVTPDSATLPIGDIVPSPPVGGGERTDTSTIAFTITPKTNGVTPPGSYIAECTTPSDPTGATTDFVLTGEAEATTTSETQASTTTTAAPTTTETAPTTTTTATPEGQFPPGGVTLEGKVIDGEMITGKRLPAYVFYDYKVTENTFVLQILPVAGGTGPFTGEGTIGRRWEAVLSGSNQEHYVLSDVATFTLVGTWDGADPGHISARVTIQWPPDKRKVELIHGKVEFGPMEALQGIFEGTWSTATGQLTGKITAGWVQSTLQAQVVATPPGA